MDIGRIPLFSPSFDNQQTNGEYVPVTPITGEFVDKHGIGVTILQGASGSVSAKQYYWYKLNDGAAYEFWDVQNGFRWEGDRKDEQRALDRTITYSVGPDGSGGWNYKIDKASDVSTPVQIAITQFPWTAQ